MRSLNRTSFRHDYETPFQTPCHFKNSDNYRRGETTENTS